MICHIKKSVQPWSIKHSSLTIIQIFGTWWITIWFWRPYFLWLLSRPRIELSLIGPTQSKISDLDEHMIITENIKYAGHHDFVDPYEKITTNGQLITMQKYKKHWVDSRTFVISICSRITCYSPGAYTSLIQGLYPNTPTFLTWFLWHHRRGFGVIFHSMFPLNNLPSSLLSACVVC